jgi:putative ABC transport system substrate-binding protein
MTLQRLSRRQYLAAILLLGLELAPRKARAQPRVRRLAVPLADTAAGDAEAFLKRLSEFGWIEGRNLVIERGTSGLEEAAIDAAVRNLLAGGPDVLLAMGTPYALAATKATSAVAIVFSIGTDPVAAGLVKSLARPGGNATGVYNSLPLLEAKRLSHLRELIPGLRRVAVLLDGRNAYWTLTRESREAAYRSLALVPEYIEVPSVAAITPAVEESAARGAQAVLVESSGFWDANRPMLIDTARRHRLPVVAADEDLAKAGALLSLSRDGQESDQTILTYIDRILRGTRPGELPVQEPRKFVLALNLSTAKTLGVNVPQDLLVRADRVFR